MTDIDSCSECTFIRVINNKSVCLHKNMQRFKYPEDEYYVLEDFMPCADGESE